MHNPELRYRMALRFRNWIHEQESLTRCHADSNDCLDWPLAYELADMALAVDTR